MLVFGQDNRRSHLLALAAVCVATLLFGLWCWQGGYTRGTSAWHWPRGSSPVGFTLGVVGGLIMTIEMLLLPRKAWWRGLRIGRAKHWMLAHLWLGVLVFPLLLMHGGFHFDLQRSTLAAVLMWLLVAVCVSGVLGSVIQNIVPRLLLEQVPDETIASQIDDVLNHYIAHAEARLKALGTDTTGSKDQRLSGDSAEVTDSLGLVHERVARFLRTGARDRELATPSRAKEYFQRIRRRLERPADRDYVEMLEDYCSRRTQFDIQRRLQRVMHSWLAVHLALSTALFTLMLAHVVLALKYV